MYCTMKRRDHYRIFVGAHRMGWNDTVVVFPAMRMKGARRAGIDALLLARIICAKTNAPRLMIGLKRAELVPQEAKPEASRRIIEEIKHA